MNGVNHAATALLIHRKWPGVPMVLALLSVQLVEILWVVLNLVGVEATTTSPQVRALDDIQLADMPYSHSIAGTVILAFAVWAVCAGWLRKPTLGIALAAGVASHIVLDLATHVPDIALAPGFETLKLGTGLYAIPTLALVVETLYGVFCWWMFRGSRVLLAVMIGMNLCVLPFYSSIVPGPERFLAGHPLAVAVVVGVHTLLGLVVIGYFARPQWRMPSPDSGTSP